MIFQRIVAHACRLVSRWLRLQRDGCYPSSTMKENGAQSDWTYFRGFGPIVLIVRDNKVVSLSGLCAIRVQYDTIAQSGKILSCKPLLSLRQKGDKVFFGQRRVYREYAKLSPA